MHWKDNQTYYSTIFATLSTEFLSVFFKLSSKLERMNSAAWSSQCSYKPAVHGFFVGQSSLAHSLANSWLWSSCHCRHQDNSPWSSQHVLSSGTYPLEILRAWKTVVPCSGSRCGDGRHYHKWLVLEPGGSDSWKFEMDVVEAHTSAGFRIHNTHHAHSIQ